MDYEKLANEIAAMKRTYILKKFGRHIGKGSSRTVFRVREDLVAKIAMNQRGLNQNDQEYDFSLNFGNSHDNPIIAETFAISEDSRVVISEYAEPRIGMFSDEEKKNIGIHKVEYSINRDLKMVGNVLSGVIWEDFGNYNYDGLVYICKNAFKKTGSCIGFRGDFIRPSSFGKNKAGRWVLIDYGFLRER